MYTTSDDYIVIDRIDGEFVTIAEAQSNKAGEKDPLYFQVPARLKITRTESIRWKNKIFLRHFSGETIPPKIIVPPNNILLGNCCSYEMGYCIVWNVMCNKTTGNIKVDFGYISFSCRKKVCRKTCLGRNDSCQIGEKR